MREEKKKKMNTKSQVHFPWTSARKPQPPSKALHDQTGTADVHFLSLSLVSSVAAASSFLFKWNFLLKERKKKVPRKNTEKRNSVLAEVEHFHFDRSGPTSVILLKNRTNLLSSLSWRRRALPSWYQRIYQENIIIYVNTLYISRYIIGPARGTWRT